MTVRGRTVLAAGDNIDLGGSALYIVVCEELRSH